MFEGIISIDNLIGSAVLGGTDVLETAEEAETRAELQDDIEQLGQPQKTEGNSTEVGETLSETLHLIFTHQTKGLMRNMDYILWISLSRINIYPDTADISLKIILMFIYYSIVM